MYTVLVTLDNKRVIIPNSTITSSNIINYNAENRRRLDLVFSVSYDADISKAKEVLLDVVKENNLILNPKMEVVSHNLLTNLIEANFGIGVVTKEFVQNKLNNTLFKIDIKEEIPKRKLGYAIKKDIYPNFTTQKIIELLTNNK